MATDQQRIEKIQGMSYNDAMDATDKMCKLIKKADKAWLRAKIAYTYKDQKMRSVSQKFRDRAAELGHEEAKRAKDLAFKKYCIRLDIIDKNRFAKIVDTLNKFCKEVHRKTDVTCTPSRTCPYPYGNGNDKAFIRIGHVGDDFDYSGYMPGGPEAITYYRRKYLGKNLSKIATIAKRYNVDIFKDHSRLYITFPYKQFDIE